MASLILIQRYFNPLIGGFEVKVIVQNRRRSRKNKSIEVVYNQYINSVHPTFHYASLPLNGAQISDDEAEQLLKNAEVPSFIHGGAVEMILRCVNETLIQGRVMVRIVFDNEASGLSEFESDDDDEEEDDHVKE